ncbi:MAG: N-acetylneuraminate synthase family protein, partial [Planctomycetes bacterium]|nr:N-acetylneuraminate synthase family protein [Planctomycetota bacterium]
RSLGVDRLKLPSTISEHKDYLEYAAAQDIPELVISTGMTDEAYERFVLSTFTRQERLYLLHCVSSYPTSPSFTNIAVVRRYSELARRMPHLVPGYSSHDVGSFGCALAVAAGARMIEKHIKIGSTSWAHFDDTALDVQHEFPEFVRTIRAAHRVCGSDAKTIQASEHHKYKVVTGPHVNG